MTEFPLEELMALHSKFYNIGIKLEAIIISDSSLFTTKRPGWNTMEAMTADGAIKILTERGIKSKIRHVVSEAVINGVII